MCSLVVGFGLTAGPAQAQTDIAGGTYSNGYYAGSSNSPYTISGATFTGDYPDPTSGTSALEVGSGAQVNISSGNFYTGSLNGVAVQVDGGGDLNISGGEFGPTPGGNGITDDGVYTQFTPASITISGGDFSNSENQGLFLGGGSFGTVSGGTFENNGQGALYTQGSLLNVTGGSFSGGYGILLDNGVANVAGGDFDSGSSFLFVNGGALNIYGTDLSFGDGQGGSVRSGGSGGGMITGTLADGTSLNDGYNFFDSSDPGVVRLNPGTTSATAYTPTSNTLNPDGTTTGNYTGVSRGIVTIGAGNYLGPDGQVYTPQENYPAGSIQIQKDITVYPGQGVNEAGNVVALNPDGSVPGGGIIPAAPVYVDPAPAYGYTYSMTSGTLFTELTDLPTGFGSDFDIIGDGFNYGDYAPGQTLMFDNGGVSSFTITGVTPAPGNTSDFVLGLDFSAPTVNFTVTPLNASAVPEPSSFALLGLGLLPLGLLARKKNARI